MTEGESGMVGTPSLKRASSSPVPFEGEDGLFTQSWYPICLSSAATAEFVRGFDFLDGRVLVFRDEQGTAHVMSAYCPHLGADLSMGDIVNGQVRCIFHHWRYDATGRCVALPSTDPVPPTARLFEFPCQEKFGIVWAYNGTEPHYDIPDFSIPESDLVFKAKIFGELMPVDPWILCANTPDMQHIRYLHGVEINGENPHEAAEWTDHSLRYSFDATHVTGDPISHNVAIYGTTLYCQETNFSGRWFGFMSPFGLVRPGQSQVFFVVCTPKAMGTPEEIDAFLDWVIELETRVVLDDVVNMKTIHFRPGTLTKADTTLARFFRYMREFPRAHPSADFIR